MRADPVRQETASCLRRRWQGTGDRRISGRSVCRNAYFWGGKEANMDVSVTWHGHSNFQIAADGITILIDPFFTGNPAARTSWKSVPPPDLTLVTHDHGDHVGDAVAICTAAGTPCGCTVGTAARLIAAGLAPDLVPGGIGFNIGGSIEVKGARVTMTQAFHTSDSGSPAGYIITLPHGFTIYHAGDTGIFQSMALLGELYPMDLALLPIGGFFTMDAFQAAHAARLLNAKAVTPMHWGTFPVLAPNPDEFTARVREVAPNTRPVIMRPGETVRFS